MAFNFDDEWFQRLSRQMEQIRRLLASPALEAAMRQLQSIQPHLEQMDRAVRPQLDAVNRALRAWNEGPAQQYAAQYQRLAEQVERATESWRGQLPQIIEAAQRAAEAAQASWEAAVPTNWRDLTFAEIESVLNLMEESGWALVWTPRTEIIRRLLESNPDAREETLLAAEDEILGDLSTATAGLQRDELRELAAANGEAIASFRDSRLLAAQALSTVIFTTLFHRYIDAKFSEARTAIEPLDPREATLENVRLYCVLRAVLVAIETYFGRDQEPVPTRFNRHASTHRLSAEQYTRLNALAALMLGTSLLCEVDTSGGLLPPMDT